MRKNRCQHRHFVDNIERHHQNWSQDRTHNGKKHGKQHGKEYSKHYGHHKEFTRYRRILHIVPIIILLLIVLMTALLYRWSGRENFTTLILGLFGFLIVKEILQALFFKRISRRFIEPLINLKTGFDIIGDGDYSIRVQEVHHGDMRQLFRSFNAMAEKLEENEEIKKQYEENRKLLIANISHDLKTPITTVGGYLEVMEEGVVKDPEKLYKYIQVMKNNTDYMNKLIDDLFLYSKLDIDQVQFDFVNVNAKDFLNDMMEEFHIAMTDVGFEFNYNNEISPSAMLYTDGKRLHRAIKNIVDNSEKYAKVDEKPKIDIEMFSSEGFLTIKFRDFGPGIPDDKICNVFDRFFRVDDERTKNLNSTGLGLAITKELVEAHNGLIVAGNHNDGGAIFFCPVATS